MQDSITSKTRQRDIKRLQKAIVNAQKKIEAIQEACPHTEYYIYNTYEVDYDDGYGRWWKSKRHTYRCVDCDKYKNDN